ncbi:MAG: NUDIX hydrolase [Chlamydiae bacterium]|nr:NUDIX hydrolase [Chlamydiota bacterium]
MFKESPLLPKVTGSQRVYEGFFNIRVDQLEIPPDQHMPYTILETKHHAVVVLAYTKEGKILVLKEYRHPVGKWLFGCPGGTIDPGESPIEAGKRELLEETGYTADTFIILGSACPFPSAASQTISYILATGAKKNQEPNLEPFELVECEEKTEEELCEAIRLGHPVDGILCTALLFQRIANR